MINSEEIPVGWSIARLSDPDIAILNPKKSELRGISDDTEVTFVPMSAVDEIRGTITRADFRKLGAVRKGYTYFAENDVIFAKITPCMENGKCAIARGLSNSLGFGSTEFHVIRARNLAVPEWLHLILRSKQARENARNSMHGAAGQQRVPVAFLERLEIPVPPLIEQQRLVARVEAAVSRSQELRDLNASLVEDASRVLNAEYNRISRNVPCRHFGELAKLLRRQVSKKSDESYLEMGIRSFGNGTFHKPALTGRQLGGKRVFRIKASDLVFMNVFAWEGAIAVAKPEDDGRVGSHRFMTHEVDLAQATPEFLCYYFLTEYGLEKIRAASPGSAGRNRTLGITKLHTIPVPVPPVEAQRRFSQLHTLREKLRRMQIQTEAELAAFTPALLAKVFRGEL